jgi:hypothetical protein
VVGLALAEGEALTDGEALAVVAGPEEPAAVPWWPK